MDKPTPEKPPTPKAAWSVAEFCVRYNLSKGAAFKLIREQEIERVKFGRRTLIPVESADAWWARQR